MLKYPPGPPPVHGKLAAMCVLYGVLSFENRPAEVHAAIEDPAFVRTFGQVEGDRLKRAPAGFPADHPEAELLKLKDIIFSRRLSDDDAFSPDLPDQLTDDLTTAMPVLRLLAGMAGPAAP
jgi:uncharacterized protein (DUF2461 family)